MAEPLVSTESLTIEELKKIRLERVTLDGVVCNSPCLLYSVIIASDGVGEGDADLYDGTSIQDERKLDLYTVDEMMYELIFNTPVYMRKGIYIDIGTNCESVVVQYMPLRW